MGKIEELFRARIKFISDEFRNNISEVPMWKLDSTLPKEIRSKSFDEKIEYLIEKYKNSNPIYLLLNDDLKLLEFKSCSVEELKSLNVDPRYLESMGLNEMQIIKHYEFTNSVKDLL